MNDFKKGVCAKQSLKKKLICFFFFFLCCGQAAELRSGEAGGGGCAGTGPPAPAFVPPKGRLQPHGWKLFPACRPSQAAPGLRGRSGGRGKARWGGSPSLSWGLSGCREAATASGGKPVETAGCPPARDFPGMSYSPEFRRFRESWRCPCCRAGRRARGRAAGSAGLGAAGPQERENRRASSAPRGAQKTPELLGGQ